MYQYYSILDENCYFVPIFYRIVLEPYRIMRKFYRFPYENNAACHVYLSNTNLKQKCFLKE